MKMNTFISTLLVAGSTIIAVTNTFAITNEEQGITIATKRKQLDSGWGDSQASMTMLLTNANGDTSERRLRMKMLEVENDGDKGLTIFDTPLDVKGTAFLNFSHTTEADEQWLYLPALKRVKRIASKNKSGPFMGSEFAYEDLSSFELAKYQFNYLGEQMLDNQSTFLLEQIPVDKNSGYTKQHVWLDKLHYQPLKVEYYDRKGALLKTLTLRDYQMHLGKFWRAHTLEMDNVQTHKATRLTTESLEFSQGLAISDFNQASLQRAR
ncbi:outer membrane lipoprotein-sorting protein [Pseudoalteromonas xiamenensis]